MSTVYDVRLLGNLTVVRGEEVIDRFPTRKTAGLLALLALNGDRRIPRDTLAELLWPDGEPEPVRNRLNQAVSELRRILHAPDEGSYLIEADRHSIGLRAGAFDTDVARVRGFLARAQAGDLEERFGALVEAANAFTDWLLVGLDEDWLMTPRLELYESLTGLATELHAADEIGRFRRQQAEVDRRILVLDPADDTAHRRLIEYYIERDNPQAALHQYETLRRQLARFSAEVEPEAAALAEHARVMLTRRTLPRSIDLRQWTDSIPVRARLPSYLTKFVARDAELDRVEAALRSGERLVAISGLGGIGKTRLAVEVAERVAEAFDGNVAFVSLESVEENTVLLAEIARQVGVHHTVSHETPEGLAAKFAVRRPILLVLDGLERLVEQGFDELARFLEAAPTVTLLTTSRVALRLRGAVEIALRPLDVPAAGVCSPHIVASSPAVALFASCARCVDAGFVVSGENAADVALLCRRLDGIPLALELAAGWLRSMSPRQIVERLEPDLNAIAGGQSDVPARQRSLGDVFEATWSMLDSHARDVFVRLATFCGGWDLDAARDVCGGERLEEGLDALVSHGLVFRDVSAGAERFDMLATTHRFVSSRPEAMDVLDLKAMHVEFFQRRARELLALPREESAALYAADFANFLLTGRRLFAWGRYEELGRFVLDLSEYWEQVGYIGSAIEWLEPAIGATDGALRTRLQVRLGLFLLDAGDPVRGIEVLGATDAEVRVDEDKGARLEVAIALGKALHQVGRVDEERAMIERALELARDLNDPSRTARCYRMLGNLEAEAGAHDSAERHYRMSREFAEDAGDPYQVATALGNLGNLCRMCSRFEEAAELLRRSLQVAMSIDARGLFPDIHVMQAMLALDQGQPLRALAMLGDAFVDGIEDFPTQAAALRLYALVFESLGAKREALTVAAFATSGLKRLGAATEGVEQIPVLEAVARLKAEESEVDAAAIDARALRWSVAEACRYCDEVGWRLVGEGLGVPVPN